MATESKSGGGIFETIKTIVYALLIAGVFRSFFFQPFWIPSGSMKDTLLIGDFLFVNKMAYGYSYASCPSVRLPQVGLDIDAEDICGWARGDNKRLFGSEPKRGDVVVFRHPKTHVDYVKRLIGMPGETIQMTNGVISINGTPVEVIPDGTFVEEYAPQGPAGSYPRCANAPVGQGAECIKEKAIEVLPNGVRHSILSVDDSSGLPDNTGVYTVPEGEYFFVGDNRDNSTDSRFRQAVGGVGFVPFDHLIGRADRILFSSAGRSMLYFWTWRSDRFFKAVN